MRRRSLMQGRIVDPDDLSGDLDGMGDVDDVLEHRGDPGRQRRLPVARRPEQQHAAAGVDRRQQLADVVLGDDEPLKAPAQALAVELLVADALAFDLIVIGHQRHRRRAKIEVLFQRFLGRRSAALAQRIADRQGEAAGSGADRLNQPLLHRLVEQLLHDAARQFEALGQLEQRLAGFDMHEFEQQVEQAALRHAGLGHSRGNRRRGIDHLGQLLGAEQSHRDQVVAQPSAFDELPCERRLETPPDQDIAEMHCVLMPVICRSGTTLAGEG